MYISFNHLLKFQETDKVIEFYQTGRPDRSRSGESTFSGRPRTSHRTSFKPSSRRSTVMGGGDKTLGGVSSTSSGSRRGKMKLRPHQLANVKYKVQNLKIILRT